MQVHLVFGELEWETVRVLQLVLLPLSILNQISVREGFLSIWKDGLEKASCVDACHGRAMPVVNAQNGNPLVQRAERTDRGAF
jgi:hypothetical protein